MGRTKQRNDDAGQDDAIERWTGRRGKRQTVVGRAERLNDEAAECSSRTGDRTHDAAMAECGEQDDVTKRLNGDAAAAECDRQNGVVE